MTVPLLYTAENDYIGDDIEAYRAWYAWRHAPDVWRLGFLSCASYRVVEGDMSVFSIYEISSTDIFSSSEYKAIPQKDRYRSRMDGSIGRRAHTLYQQTPISGEEWRRLDADWISAFRFDSSESETVLCSRLSGIDKPPGMTALRLARRSAHNRPGSVTDRPSYMAVAEYAGKPPLGPVAWAGFAQSIGPVSATSAYVTGDRLYPWPDDPARTSAPIS